ERDLELLRLELAEPTLQLEIPLVIGGEEVRTGDTFEAVQPHDRSHVLATVHKGGADEVNRAAAAAAEAWEDWSRTPWEERAAIFLRAAELLTGRRRATLNAATAAYAAWWLMKLYEEAGLPPGVINLVYGDGAAIGDPALGHPDLAGVHFTGSTPVFQSMWKTIGDNIGRYRNYPRIVGETG